MGKVPLDPKQPAIRTLVSGVHKLALPRKVPNQFQSSKAALRSLPAVAVAASTEYTMGPGM